MATILLLMTVGLAACTSSHGAQVRGRPDHPARVIAVQNLGQRIRDLTVSFLRHCGLFLW
jgi:hypothetical protein